LYLYGYSVPLTGQLDRTTQAALEQFSIKRGVSQVGVDQSTYLALFENVPVDHKTQHRRKIMPEASIAYAQAQELIQNNQQLIIPAEQIDDGHLTLWTNKADYNIGEKMTVNFSVDKPMFVRLVVINSSGEISTLFPNVYQSDNYCKPGITYQVPPQQADFTLDIGGPSGIDKIRAVASSKPIAAESLFFTADGHFDESKMSLYPVRAVSDIVIH